MIYPELFLNFLMVGALSFGGGFGMISLIRDAVLSHGWLTEAELMSFIAVAESTPGPIAVNMATFVGASQAGALGAFLATLGVVLPAFLIILLIASVLKNLMRYRLTNAFLSGVRPCVVGMILATALTMGLSTLLGYSGGRGPIVPDGRAIGLFAVLWAVRAGWIKWKKSAPPLILMILLSALLGMLLWSS